MMQLRRMQQSQLHVVIKQSFDLSRSKYIIDWNKNIAAMTGCRIRSMTIIFLTERAVLEIRIN
jgi:hypothetical protein